MNKIILTGIAGFIGHHLAKSLSGGENKVIGLDNLDDYYDVSLKVDRLNDLGFSFKDQTDIPENQKIEVDSNLALYRLNIDNRENLSRIFQLEQPDMVVHLAAQAGVRYSIENPYRYIESNISSFLNILENCRKFKIKHLVYASSSSVYGLNRKLPYSEHDYAVHPVSLYGATKKSNELMAHAYSQLFSIPTTGLRFFTVYGPWGRPDMSPIIFTRKIFSGEELEVFNHGKMKRDFTYIDDIVEGISLVLSDVPAADSGWDSRLHDPQYSTAPYRIFNIGNSKPEKLMDFIETLEGIIGRKAKKKFLPMQPGDVLETFSDSTELFKATGFKPQTDLSEGLNKFIAWYRGYYEVKK
jgi:UDP-glucuronate 4-epimerase